jgi:hypothetical protein
MGGRNEYVRKVDSATGCCNATFSIRSFVTILKLISRADSLEGFLRRTFKPGLISSNITSVST